MPAYTRLRFLNFLALIFLASCDGTTTPIVLATNVPTGTVVVQATATQEIFRDCGFGAFAEVWIDENENGVWDPGEPPLAGVTVTENGGAVSARGKTNANGRALVDSGLQGCPIPTMHVYVSTPPGFRATTPDILPRLLCFGRGRATCYGCARRVRRAGA
jgi:hypothetical protein